jgi:hypothetical protein
MDGEFFYSEFVIGSCRFLYPINNWNLLSKIKKEEEEVKVPYLVKFIKPTSFLTFAAIYFLVFFYLMTVFTLSYYFRFRLF